MASSLGRASTMLASGTLVSRVLGFVMAILSAHTIGAVTAPGADAFTIANQLPNTVYTIIAGGALNAVLVPQIVRAGLHADGGATFINRLVTLALSLLVVTTVAATLLAPTLVNIYAPAYGDTQFDLALAFAFWTIPQVFFYGLYTILGEVLNARGSFGPFTWAPVVNNVVAITGLVVFNVLFGADPTGARPVEDWSAAMIAVLAGSATLGVVMQGTLLAFFWRRVGLRYRPDFRIRGVGLGTAGTMAFWSFLTVLLTIGAGVVESAVSSVASGYGPSSKALQTSWLVFMLPHSVIAVSIATAYFTKMSGHASRNEHAEFRGDVSASVRVVGMFLVFAAAALIVVALPFSAVFTRSFEDTQAMGLIVVAYVIALPLFSTLAIVQRAFYALSDGRTPFLFTLVQALVVAGGCVAALSLPRENIAVGIALATSISIITQALVAGALLRRKLGGTGGGAVIKRFAHYGLAVLPAAAVGALLLLLLGGTTDGGFATSGIAQALVSMAAIGLPMAVVYLGILWLIKVPELRAFAAPILRRLGR